MEPARQGDGAGIPCDPDGEACTIRGPANMNDSMRIARGTLLLVLLIISLPRPLAAYLDPGSGSFLLQVLVAGLLGASFAVRRFWGDIKGFFRKGFSRGSDSSGDGSSSGS